MPIGGFRRRGNAAQLRDGNAEGEPPAKGDEGTPSESGRAGGKENEPGADPAGGTGAAPAKWSCAYCNPSCSKKRSRSSRKYFDGFLEVAPAGDGGTRLTLTLEDGKSVSEVRRGPCAVGEGDADFELKSGYARATAYAPRVGPAGSTDSARAPPFPGRQGHVPARHRRPGRRRSRGRRGRAAGRREPGRQRVDRPAAVSGGLSGLRQPGPGPPAARSPGPVSVHTITYYIHRSFGGGARRLQTCCRTRDATTNQRVASCVLLLRNVACVDNPAQ